MGSTSGAVQPRLSTRVWQSSFDLTDVCRLRTLRPLSHFVLHTMIFGKSEMEIRAFYEAEDLAAVEPLDDSDLSTHDDKASKVKACDNTVLPARQTHARFDLGYIECRSMKPGGTMT